MFFQMNYLIKRSDSISYIQTCSNFGVSMYFCEKNFGVSMNFREKNLRGIKFLFIFAAHFQRFNINTKVYTKDLRKHGETTLVPVYMTELL